MVSFSAFSQVQHVTPNHPIEAAKFNEIIDSVNAANPSAQVQRLESLESADSAEKAKVINLQNSVSNLNSADTAEKAKVTALQSDVGALQSSDTAEKAKVVTLQGNVTALQNSDTAEKAKVVTLQSDVSGLKAAPSGADLQTLINSLQAQINQLKADAVPVVGAYQRTNAQPINHATDTTMVYDSKIIDTNNSFNTSNGRYSCPTKGYYRISSSVFFTAYTAGIGNAFQMRFIRRSSGGAVFEDYYKDNVTAEATTGRETALKADHVVYCSVGDTLETVVYQNSGAQRSTIGYINFMSVFRIGPAIP